MVAVAGGLQVPSVGSDKSLDMNVPDSLLPLPPSVCLFDSCLLHRLQKKWSPKSTRLCRFHEDVTKEEAAVPVVHSQTFHRR